MTEQEQEAATPEELAVAAAAGTAALRRTVDTTRSIVIFMLAFGAVAIALALTWVFVQSYQGRQEVVATQRLGCARGILDRADAIGDELDEASFRRDAAAARQRAGTPLDLRTAKHYRRLAERAKARAESKIPRLLGAPYSVVTQRVPKGRPEAGRPTRAAIAAAATACATAYPSASPWPWDTPDVR